MSKSLKQAVYNCDSSSFNAQVFDLFCSIGGLTYGLKRAGIAVNAGLDIDGSCRYAYENNCKATFIEADIRENLFFRYFQVF